jgi:hypothetical protein
MRAAVFAARRPAQRADQLGLGNRQIFRSP